MDIAYIHATDAGDRPINEDRLFCTTSETAGCFCLCDGLGGHGLGDRASQCVCAAVKEQWQELGEAQSINNEIDLKKIAFSAQSALLREQTQSLRGNSMLTTLCMLTIRGNLAQYLHVGDSRLYYFHAERLIRQTLDHSVPQKLVESGLLKPSRIRGHADRNRLLHVMGVEWPEDPSWLQQESLEIQPGDAFLLCSDGFWEWIDERLMRKTLKRAFSVQDWLQSMLQKIPAKGSGKHLDNYSAIAIWVTGG